MKRPPTPRDRIYDLYWYFASERQAIFEKRVAGEAPPWTTDQILETYKFCNVYRAADRVSQYLIREVAYSDEPAEPADRLFQILSFRMFSRIETWQQVRTYLGHAPTLQNLADGSFIAGLEHAKKVTGGLYTGAFILCANNAYGFTSKHLNHVELFRDMFLRSHLSDQILNAGSFRAVHELLLTFPLMGNFMSYQIAIDLNYSSLVNFDENDFTQPGPGALRGLQKAFCDFGDYSPTEIIQWMVNRQHEEFARLGLRFRGLWGRPLHAIDCQGLFCELDKYCREAAPELLSARKRIKSHFNPSSEGITLFFPPKWGINDRLPSTEVLLVTPRNS